MKNYRPHRFPPLSHFLRSGGAGAMGASGWQPSSTEGFQQGFDDGYREGVASGRENGVVEGREAGVLQGRELGRQETLVAHDKLARPVDAMLKALKKLETEYQTAQRKEVVELVGKVARRVIRAELALQPMQLLALVDETLAAMPASRESVEVYLNPEELARIRDLDPKRAKRWALIADPRLQAGECRVKSGDQEADAGCEQRLVACLEQVASGLLGSEEAQKVAA